MESWMIINYYFRQERSEWRR